MSLASLSLPDIGFGPLTPSRHAPIYTQLPRAQTALTRKYSNPSLQSALAGLPPHIRTAFVNYDLQRAARGTMPLTGTQTLGALQTALQQKPATPPPHEGLMGRVVSDIRSLVDIPHIVTGLVGEAKSLPEAPEKLAEVLGRGSPREVVAGLGEVPGLRLVPGVYTASTLAQGGPQALLEHPVYTALDVLPYAKEPISMLANRAAVASAFPGGEARAAAVAGERARLADLLKEKNVARLAEDQPELPTPKPLSNVRLALRTSPTMQTLSDLPFIRQVAGNLGKTARDEAQLQAGLQHQLDVWANPATREGHPLVTPNVEDIHQIIKNINELGKNIPEARIIELTQRATLESRESLFADPTLTDHELGLVSAIRDAPEIIGTRMVERGLLDRIGGEFYDLQSAKKIRQAEARTARRVGVNDLRNRLAESTPGEFPAFDVGRLLNEAVTNKDARLLGKGAAHLVDKSGFDAAAIRDATRGKATREGIAQAIRDTQADPVPNDPLLTRQETLDRIVPHAQAERRVGPEGEVGTAAAEVAGHIRNNDWIHAWERWRETLGARKTFVIPDSDLIGDSLRRYADADRYARDTAGFTDRAVTNARNREALVKLRNQPARFLPKFEQLRYVPGDRTTAMYRYFADDPAAIADLDRGRPDMVPGWTDKKVQREINDDALKGLQTMRDNGFNPLYQHQVAPEVVREVIHPSFTETLKTPSQVKRRTLDATPWTPNAVVGISHQANEFLSHLQGANYIDGYLGLFGKSEQEALGEVWSLAQRMGKGDPAAAREAASTLRKRRFVRYDPANYFKAGTPGLGITPSEDIFIPKAIDIALQRTFHDGYRFTSKLDPVMNLFRTSVLAFSLRFHFNNTFGGAMIMGLEDPSTIPYMVTHWGEIRDFIKSGQMETVPGMPPIGIGFFDPKIRDYLMGHTVVDRVRAAHDVAAANTALRWVDESINVGKSAKDRVKRMADWSYRANEHVDTWYRATAYLSGRDKALRAGMTAEQAQAAGVALVRKILPEWDRYTPLERTVIRSFFPFYSFEKFIIQYALRYPFDHPFRTSVMSSVARNEYEDGNAGWLPLNMAKMFFLGQPDKDGNVHAIDPGGINPFQDVGSLAGILANDYSGLVGRTNPVIDTALQVLGVDPRKGGPDLYPDVSYDPQTGTLKAVNPSFLSTFIGNVVPQSQMVTALIDRNSNFAGMLRANPEAAMSMIRSSVGVPNLFRVENLPQAAFKAEVSRQASQDQARNKALKSGDWGEAMKYPGLRPFFQKLGKVMDQNPEVLKAYQAQIQQQTIRDVLPTALLARNLPVG